MNALPLAGRRILVTRAAHQAGKLSEALRELGAEPVEVPVLEMRPPASYDPLDRALLRLDEYDWLILTSANTVHELIKRFATLGIETKPPIHMKVAAVGASTADAARQAGFPVTLVPESYVSESLVEGILAAHNHSSVRDSSEGGGGFNPRILPSESPRALAPEERSHPNVPPLNVLSQISNVTGHDFSRADMGSKGDGALAPANAVPGKRILIARAAIARDIIPDALRAAGAEVDVVDAYQNVLPESAPEQLRQALAQKIDAATFTSSSSVTHLAKAAKLAGVEFPMAGVPAISIGPITSQTLRDAGWPPAAEANPSDIAGLIASVVRTLRVQIENDN